MRTILLLISIIIPLSVMAEELSFNKQDIKEFVNEMPFDFEQISQDAEAYKIYLFRERERRLQFVDIDKYPTPQERRRYYILHAIDVSMTIWALNNRAVSYTHLTLPTKA